MLIKNESQSREYDVRVYLHNGSYYSQEVFFGEYPILWEVKDDGSFAEVDLFIKELPEGAAEVHTADIPERLKTPLTEIYMEDCFCRAAGYVIAFPGAGKVEIHRCDECERFESDEAAAASQQAQAALADFALSQPTPEQPQPEPLLTIKPSRLLDILKAATEHLSFPSDSQMEDRENLLNDMAGIIADVEVRHFVHIP